MPPVREVQQVKISLIKEKIPEHAFERVRPPAPVSLAGRAITGLSLTEGAVSFARNVIKAGSLASSRSWSMVGTGYLTAGIGLFLTGAVRTRGALHKFRHAELIGDGEGKRRAQMNLATGILSTNASALALVHSIAPVTIASLSAVTDALFGIGSLASIAVAGVGMYRSVIFRSRLNKVLEQKASLHSLTSPREERKNLIKALEFLKEKAIPTQEEVAELIKAVKSEHPEWGVSAQETEVRKKLINLAEVKINYMRRRTSQKAAEMIIHQMPALLERLRREDASPAEMSQARILVKGVLAENRKKTILLAIAILLSALAFTALILGTFFSFGTLPVILYTVTSGIGLLMALYPLVVDSLRKTFAAQAINLMPIIFDAEPIHT
ncbi:MAG: hypothetical protein HY861_05200 [Chlamydiia bacterium]|nr:hypothetical protein [Chlamydiia bacterium]